MNRRKFFQLTGAGALATATASIIVKASPIPGIDGTLCPAGPSHNPVFYNDTIMLDQMRITKRDLDQSTIEYWAKLQDELFFKAASGQL